MFKVGDIIVLERDYWVAYKSKLVKGTLGKVMELRTYHSHSPTHYVIKFTCYKIPHLYMRADIDDNCKLYNVKKQNSV